jgi:Ca2+-binding EF-hand superfamily protein
MKEVFGNFLKGDVVLMSGNDQAIFNKIDEIWIKYDTDKNGVLDREETRTFVRENFEALGTDRSLLEEDKFNAVFNNFDKDGSGGIDKSEMYKFIKSIVS